MRRGHGIPSVVCSVWLGEEPWKYLQNLEHPSTFLPLSIRRAKKLKKKQRNADLLEKNFLSEGGDGMNDELLEGGRLWTIWDRPE